MEESRADGPIVHSPEEVARRLGGVSVKTLADLIRDGGFEVTELGFAERSPRGGNRRRLWGMTDEQVDRLLAARRRPAYRPRRFGSRKRQDA